jgi:branched-subunit amino acid ABC-type transport system permease component
VDYLNFLLDFLIDGLLLGFVYGLAAMGLTLIWGVMNVINLAHGPLIALGAFGVYLLFTGLGMNPYLALPLVAVVGFLLGFVMYWVAINRVIEAPQLSTLLSTFSVNMILIGLGTAIFSTSPRNVAYSLGSIDIGNQTIPTARLIAALATIVVAGLMYLFLQRTTLGKNVRAVASNRQAAELMGIPSRRILALSFGLGAMLAAIAGGLIATIFPFTILVGNGYQTKSFVIGVLGGLGNPLGALAGGLILGALEGLIPAFMPITWAPVIEFVLFIIILLVWPNGIFGRRDE